MSGLAVSLEVPLEVPLDQNQEPKLLELFCLMQVMSISIALFKEYGLCGDCPSN
ncbi:MAG: hypothetical protein AB8A46_08715 [Prochlorococcus sp.]